MQLRGAVRLLRSQRETVSYLQDHDELVWTPEVYEAKKTVCMWLSALRFIRKKDNSCEQNNYRWEFQWDKHISIWQSSGKRRWKYKKKNVTSSTFTNAVCFQMPTLQPCPKQHQSGPWWDKDLQGIEAASSGRERHSWRAFDGSGAKVRLKNKGLAGQVITHQGLASLHLAVVFCAFLL